jgi:alpha-mannosidase
LSVLRSPKSPDPEADMGGHTIRFAIGRHEPVSREGVLSTSTSADALYTPVLIARGSAEIRSPFTLVETGSLTPSWVLPCENSKGYVIRLHETNGGSGTAVLRLNRPAFSVDYVDFLERPRGRPEKSGPGEYRISYRPYQILSVRVRL